jgi:hypothetical protein
MLSEKLEYGFHTPTIEDLLSHKLANYLFQDEPIMRPIERTAFISSI